MKILKHNHNFIQSYNSVNGFLRGSEEFQPKKKRVRFTSFHLSKKATIAIATAIIIILLTSIFSVLLNAPTNTDVTTPTSTVGPSPTGQQTPGATDKTHPTLAPTETPTRTIEVLPKGPGIIESAQTMDSSVWKAVAQTAWRYFQPGIGIDYATGLPGSVSGWPYFTDWDLGVYIQAVIDANKTGLPDVPEWSAEVRFDKVLTFLEQRPLNQTTHYPFWFYQSGNGQNYAAESDLAVVTVDTVDTGRLFVALSNLKAYSPDLAQRINNIVYHGRSNYAALLPDIKYENVSTSIYAYYVASGFAAFWPEVKYVPQQILNNIISRPSIKVNSNLNGTITLPNAELTCEPLLHSIFELGILPNSTEGKNLMNISRQVYLAHEEKFNLTYAKTGEKIYAAFSEGNSGTKTFIYEWVVLPGSGTWKVTTIDRKICEPYNTYPIIYSKVALSFLALYNTSYAKDTCIYLEKCMDAPYFGWFDGADYRYTIEERNVVNVLGSNTNGLILGAARYAMSQP